MRHLVSSYRKGKKKIQQNADECQCQQEHLDGRVIIQSKQCEIVALCSVGKLVIQIVVSWMDDSLVCFWVLHWTMFKWRSLPEPCCWPCPTRRDPSRPSSDGYFPQNKHPHHKAQTTLNQCIDHCTVSGPQPNRVPLWCGETWESYHRLAANQPHDVLVSTLIEMSRRKTLWYPSQKESR